MQGKTDKKAYIMMALCPVMWSMGGALIKLLPWSGLAIAGVRSAISALVFIFAMKYVVKYRFIFNKRTLGGGLFLGYLASSFVVANKLTTAANAIVLQSTGPVFVLLASALFFKEKFRRTDYLTVFFALGGILLFFADDLSAGQMMGNLIALSAGVAMAGLYLFNSHAPSDEESMNAVFLGHVYAALFCIPLALAGEPLEITPVNVAVIVVLGVFQLGIPYVLYALSIRRLPVFTCSIISLLEPILNPLWVALFAGEIPGPFALAGSVVVVLSLGCWTVYNAKHPAVPEASPAAEGQL